MLQESTCHSNLRAPCRVALHRSLVALHAHLTDWLCCRKALAAATCVLLFGAHRSLVALHAHLTDWLCCRRALATATCVPLVVLHRSLVALHAHLLLGFDHVVATCLNGVRPSSSSYSHRSKRFLSSKRFLASKRFSASKRFFSGRGESKLSVTTTVPPQGDVTPLWSLRVSGSLAIAPFPISCLCLASASHMWS